MQKEQFFFSILGILCFLSACAPTPDQNDTCIPPLTDFAYFTGRGTPYPNNLVVPPEPWILETTVDLKVPMLLSVRVLPNKVREFWIWDSGLSTPGQNPQQQFFIFKTDGSGLKPVILDHGLAEFNLQIENVFIASNNSVWVIFRLSDRSQVPLLGKYDEAKGKIIPIFKFEEAKPDHNYRTAVLMDEKTGVFWFLVPHKYIYSYDPTSDVLVQHISIADMNPTSAVIAPDGGIYMYLFRHGSPGDEIHDALFLYTPQTETAKYIPIGLEVDYYAKNLFIDHAGRLWAGSFGWMEPNGDWYQIIRSPVFVQGMTEPRGERIYHWIPPEVRFETPNDMFWFTSYEGGTYSLNFKRGEWCRVSNSSELQKDMDGNLWMLVDKQLYKLPIHP